MNPNGSRGSAAAGRRQDVDKSATFPATVGVGRRRIGHPRQASQPETAALHAMWPLGLESGLLFLATLLAERRCTRIMGEDGSMSIEQHACDSPPCQGAIRDHRVSRVTVHSDGSKTQARECTACGKFKTWDYDPEMDGDQEVKAYV